MNPLNSPKHSQTHPEEENEKVKNMISTLPKEIGLSLNDGHIYNHKGIWYSYPILEKVLTDPKFLIWSLSESDILLCSSPKTGTTWLKALAFAIATRTRFSGPTPLLTSPPHHLIPIIEFPPIVNDESIPNLPLFSTHMPYTFFPKSVLNRGFKMVYIWRDPKDAFVSWYHFVEKVKGGKEAAVPPIDKAFDLYCRGMVPFGPYWSHLLGYWKASIENPEKVHFLKYEDMMRDPISHVIGLAKFMGFEFSEEEEMEGVPLSIVEMCSFDRLSNLEVNKRSEKSNISIKGVVLTNDCFFRKGMVGDWRSYLTQEMGDKIDHIFEEKLGPFGLKL